jgi:hypothetical protein
MSATFSINNSQNTESTRKTNIISVLQDIPDNTQQLISPRDVRDAFLSTWANSSFKLTTPQNSDIEYIGLDSSNPINRDIKSKILIGKRSFGNTDIMSNTLLNSDTDIFFYNTKLDNVSQTSTKIAILAGTNSNVYIDAPYLQVIATASQFNFNFINPSGGDINIKSNSSDVIFNNIPFPRVNDNPIDGDILKYSGIYPFGRLVWSQPESVSITNIGATGQETNIFGSTVSLNGFPLEFINDLLVPDTIGGIEQGSSFPAGSFQGQNWPLSEVIRELIYPYIEPVLEISAINLDTGYPYGDIAFTSSVGITYSIKTFSREESEDLFDIRILKDSNVIQNIGTFSDIPGSITFSSLSDSVSPTNSVIYELSLSNIINGNQNNIITTSSFELIDPFIVIFITDPQQNISNLDVISGGQTASNFLNSYMFEQMNSENFSKTILPYTPENNIPITIGTSSSVGVLYFAYPFSYPELVGIRTSTNGLISSISSYTYSINPIDLDNPYQDYRLYKSLNNVIILDSLENFELLFEYEFSNFNNFN